MHKKIRLWLLCSVPVAAMFFLALLYAAPKHVGGLSGVMPLIHLVPVFIWSVMHPRDMPFSGVALAGLFIDAATSLPLGLSALCYLLFAVMVRTQRKYIYREGFIAMWGYFAVFLLVMQAAAWAIYSYYYGMPAPVGNAVLQWMFSFLAYPILHFLLFPLVDKLGNARYRLLHA